MIFDRKDPKFNESREVNELLLLVEQKTLDMLETGKVEVRTENNRVVISRPKRTTKQQAAIEVFCRALADTLNTMGLFYVPEDDRLMRGVYMLQGFEMYWTQTLVKEKLWKPIQTAFGFGVTNGQVSTTELETWQVSKVHKCLMMHLNSTQGVAYVDFPSLR